MMEEATLRYIVSTFVNVTMYPEKKNNMLMKMKLKKRKLPV
jgi:hypothetical protein